MLKLMIECSQTGRVVHTGVETDASSFHSLRAFEATTLCPHCHHVHRWTKQDVCLAPAELTVNEVH
jgi:hypothetical protein